MPGADGQTKHTKWIGHWGLFSSPAFFRSVSKIAASGCYFRRVCLSVCPHGPSRLPLDEFSCNVLFEDIFFKSVEKIQVLLKSDKNNKFSIWRPMYLHIWYLAEFLVEWEKFQNRVAEKIKIQFLFRKLCHIWDNMEKYGTAEQGQMTTLCRTDAISVPDNWGKNRTPRLRIYNTYCFSTATTVARMHLRIMLYVHNLSCFFSTYSGRRNVRIFFSYRQWISYPFAVLDPNIAPLVSIPFILMPSYSMQEQ